MLTFLVIAALAVLAVVADRLPATAAGTTVVIAGELDPAELTVGPGTTVTWLNSDSERHRMRTVSGPDSFDSGNLDAGDSFEFVFSQVGTYEYRDDRNQGNTAYHGRIIVSAPPPASSGGSGSGAAGTPTGDSTPAGSAAAAPQSVEVSIRNRLFSPKDVTVAAGGSVRWTNSDDRVHTATARDGSFDSSIFNTGQTYQTTFPTPGSFSYFCTVHPDMTGTVVVVGDDTEPAASIGPNPPADSGGAVDPGGTADPPASNVTNPVAVAGPAVSIADFSFGPEDLQIVAGTTLMWRNDGVAPHTATANDRSFDSGLLNSGETYRRTFKTPGTFNYICAIHPEMVATLTVTGAAPVPDADPGSPIQTSGSNDNTGATDTTASAADIAAGSVPIETIDFGFAPAQVKVLSGTTVVWENTGVAPHTVTARDGSVDSGLLMTGERFSQTFTSAGTFEYFCTLHPNMVGTLLITDAAPSDVAVGDDTTEITETSASAEPSNDTEVPVSVGDVAATDSAGSIETGRTLVLVFLVAAASFGTGALIFGHRPEA